MLGCYMIKSTLTIVINEHALFSWFYTHDQGQVEKMRIPPKFAETKNIGVQGNGVPLQWDQTKTGKLADFENFVCSKWIDMLNNAWTGNSYILS